MSFAKTGLSNGLLKAVAKQGYSNPTKVQELAIPPILEGRDVIARAQTGTGKTAAFTLPLLQRLTGASRSARKRQIRALILTPTRELAAQVRDSVRIYGRGLPLSSAVVFGGVGYRPQVQALRRGVDVLVATPGRLLDHLSQKTVDLGHVEILVLDEADRMLDMGFIHDIRKILTELPTTRQSLLFSATLGPDVQKLAGKLLDSPIRIEAAPEKPAADRVTQIVHPVDRDRKTELLGHRIVNERWKQVLVFTRTKRGADRLTRRLRQDRIPTAAIHGDKTQGARTRALADFKRGAVRVLVATDIAARGLDIEQLPRVVNFELPHVPEDYIHRIGRTARAGEEGEAISLVSNEERELLAGIERLLKRGVPKSVVSGFEPRPKRKSKPPTGHARAPQPNSWRRRNKPARRRSTA